MRLELTVFCPSKFIPLPKALLLTPSILVIDRAFSLAEKTSTTIPVASQVQVLRGSIGEQWTDLLGDDVGSNYNIMNAEVHITTDELISRPRRVHRASLLSVQNPYIGYRMIETINPQRRGDD